jgi:hypothetical protein
MNSFTIIIFWFDIGNMMSYELTRNKQKYFIESPAKIQHNVIVIVVIVENRDEEIVSFS